RSANRPLIRPDHIGLWRSVAPGDGAVFLPEHWVIMTRTSTGPTTRTRAAILAAAALLVGCSELPPEPQLAVAGTDDLVRGLASVVDVTATMSGGEHLFQLSDSEIASGWTTFRFANASHSDHFVLIYRAPQEAIDAAASAGESLLEHWHGAITVPFQEEFNPYVAGDITYDAFVGNLVGAISASAPWFLAPGAPAVGGPGLTAAGRTSKTTVLLEPGTYIIECYVKHANEQFHSYNGMLQMLTVTDEVSRARAPRATAELELSSTGGIRMPDDMRPGMQTIAIRFLDQKPYEHLQGHNAQLVRLSGDDPALLDELADWMDWRAKGSLSFRAPEGAEFIGGSMEMGAGGTAYYTVNLTPGDYAWIAEVPDPASKNMLKTFSVPSSRGRGR
ncbi:MAG TPA: hypothetical protein VHG09_09510, partial [Longimicrobiales bacterium]|nr:hypothetical protein [Longimicrobiales bacterium]